jgi:hypothetical protein
MRVKNIIDVCKIIKDRIILLYNLILLQEFGDSTTKIPLFYRSLSIFKISDFTF